MRRKLIEAHKNIYQKIDERNQYFYQDPTYYGPQRRLQTIINLILQISPSWVFDIGCAEGTYGIKLAQIFQVNYVGTDVVRSNLVKMIEWRNSLSFKDRIDAVLCEASVLPFRSANADLVLCSEVLEHVINPQVVVNEIARISKEFVIISVPCFSRLHHRLSTNAIKNLWNALISSEKYSGDLHVNMFSMQTLIMILTKSKLCIRKIIGIDFIFPFRSVLIQISNFQKFFCFIESRFLSSINFFSWSIGNFTIGNQVIIVLCVRQISNNSIEPSNGSLL